MERIVSEVQPFKHPGLYYDRAMTILLPLLGLTDILIYLHASACIELKTRR